MERALLQLPADLNKWSKTCREQTLIGEQLLELSEQYKALQNHPAWQHFQGMLHGLRTNIENGILKGVAEGERDLTPQYRAIYGILLQILAMPAQIQEKKLAAEYEACLRDSTGEDDFPEQFGTPN